MKMAWRVCVWYRTPRRQSCALIPHCSSSAAPVEQAAMHAPLGLLSALVFSVTLRTHPRRSHRAFSRPAVYRATQLHARTHAVPLFRTVRLFRRDLAAPAFQGTCGGPSRRLVEYKFKLQVTRKLGPFDDSEPSAWDLAARPFGTTSLVAWGPLADGWLVGKEGREEASGLLTASSQGPASAVDAAVDAAVDPTARWCAAVCRTRQPRRAVRERADRRVCR